MSDHTQVAKEEVALGFVVTVSLELAKHSMTLTKKSKLYLRLRKRPPTMAARWITWVGWRRSNKALVCSRSLGIQKLEHWLYFQLMLQFSLCSQKQLWTEMNNPHLWYVQCTHVRSASFDVRKIHSSSSLFSSEATVSSMPLPTRPDPPVTTIRFFSPDMA